MSMNSSHPRVIAVSSGKGGVGKTFFSIHLAARAAQRGKKVLLMDADLGLANVDVMLGLKPSGTIQSVIDKDATVEDIIIHCKQGFDVIPGGSGLHELANLDVSDQQILLELLREAGSNYDLVLIDTAAGIGENVLYFVSASETALIVLTPDPTSLTDAYALIKVLAGQRSMKRFQILINQASDIEGLLTFRRLLSVSDRYLDVYLDHVGTFPSHPSVRHSIQNQELLAEHAPENINDAISKLMDSILDRPRDPDRSNGLQFFWEHALSSAMESRMQDLTS